MISKVRDFSSGAVPQLNGSASCETVLALTGFRSKLRENNGIHALSTGRRETLTIRLVASACRAITTSSIPLGESLGNINFMLREEGRALLIIN